MRLALCGRPVGRIAMRHAFEDRLVELRRFKKVHGHLLVPTTYTEQDNFWVPLCVVCDNKGVVLCRN